MPEFNDFKRINGTGVARSLQKPARGTRVFRKKPPAVSEYRERLRREYGFGFGFRNPVGQKIKSRSHDARVLN